MILNVVHTHRIRLTGKLHSVAKNYSCDDWEFKICALSFIKSLCHWFDLSKSLSLVWLIKSLVNYYLPYIHTKPKNHDYSHQINFLCISPGRIGLGGKTSIDIAMFVTVSKFALWAVFALANWNWASRIALLANNTRFKNHFICTTCMWDGSF